MIWTAFVNCASGAVEKPGDGRFRNGMSCPNCDKQAEPWRRVHAVIAICDRLLTARMDCDPVRGDAQSRVLNCQRLHGAVEDFSFRSFGVHLEDRWRAALT